jgi:cytoskeletal protein RodZ
MKTMLKPGILLIIIGGLLVVGVLVYSFFFRNLTQITQPNPPSSSINISNSTDINSSVDTNNKISNSSSNSNASSLNSEESSTSQTNNAQSSSQVASSVPFKKQVSLVDLTGRYLRAASEDEINPAIAKAKNQLLIPQDYTPSDISALFVLDSEYIKKVAEIYSIVEDGDIVLTFADAPNPLLVVYRASSNSIIVSSSF